jgi:hypothetical protein
VRLFDDLCLLPHSSVIVYSKPFPACISVFKLELPGMAHDIPTFTPHVDVRLLFRPEFIDLRFLNVSYTRQFLLLFQ